MFLRNSWYVLGWTRDLAPGKPLGRVIIGDPVVVWRDETTGRLHAAEDRCPHRHAPLSMGRVEGDAIRCMYHGMKFGPDGRCAHVPLLETPPKVAIRTYPVVEKDSWIWVWMGDADRADEALIPDAHGIDNPEQPMRANSIEYDAHYQLVHDNLCDLSHVDFVHETTLRIATGAWWAQSAPRITTQDRSVRFERWFVDADLPGAQNGETVDTWISYDFHVPGIFVLRGARYPAGTAMECGMKEPVGIEPVSRNIEQQAVTPIDATHTAYHYATGLIGNTPEMTRKLAERMDVVMATFEEDREMIEEQQKIWDRTDPEVEKLFLPQDKGPFLMRKMMERLIREEAVSEEEDA
ncbi:aromatic ring-hydroxylating dioxygenase subunit alpha [Novosphingobium mangrovi (ex Hu et al. 2023)]|uniref:Aromatic ring-hydroxylating dioxygenase subunit alpha n=1 Tax=Novosphingobium mangrovi (ex Hu et al. 2023) TaxID=2930094 RepID=A0ABT0ADZ0_9SPHN|nr:aromatic ring-hydroxylating dioxygenase subunit alpha [Novosphingobium mangrovi (ex Hu et al. 2023)]MCJ1961389.1 aromatic ring-hydroxylating dioxygenase subunit alpha [Novosphingobium mangrovi (ex Hu et al. 2023)]